MRNSSRVNMKFLLNNCGYHVSKRTGGNTLGKSALIMTSLCTLLI